MVKFSQLFRFADRTDKFLMFFGSLCGFINGIATPMFAWILGQMTDELGPTTTGEELIDIAFKFATYYFYLGASSFVLSFVMVSCWMTTG
jgi:ATP-binding cassette subfamily B (MDR/TAP) protein 1